MNERDIAPAPNGEITLFGWPWHGPCQAHVITLANSATKDVFHQPVSGNAFILRKPGIPAISRTPEQAAADAAAGEVWTNYQLQQGIGNNMIYGRETLSTTSAGLFNWIAFAADGSRWQIYSDFVFSIPNTTTGSYVFSFTVRRFGDFDHAYEKYTRTATLNLAALHLDWGDPLGTEAYYFSPQFTSWKVRLDAISEDGTVAVCSVYGRVGYTGLRSDETTTQVDYPIAIIKFTLSGSPPAIAVAVVKACSDMRFSVTYPSNPGYARQIKQGNLRYLGGYIDGAGNADGLIWVWEWDGSPEMYLDQEQGINGAYTGWLGLKYQSYSLKLRLKAMTSGAVLREYTGTELLGWWQYDTNDPSDPDYPTVGNSNCRVQIWGFDEVHVQVPPSYGVDPLSYAPTWPVGYTPTGTMRTVGPNYIRSSPPFPWVIAGDKYWDGSGGSQPFHLTNYEIFRITANLFVVAHHDGSNWKQIEAFDLAGHAWPLGTISAKLDIPKMSANPVTGSLVTGTTPVCML